VVLCGCFRFLKVGYWVSIYRHGVLLERVRLFEWRAGFSMSILFIGCVYWRLWVLWFLRCFLLIGVYIDLFFIGY